MKVKNIPIKECIAEEGKFCSRVSIDDPDLCKDVWYLGGGCQYMVDKGDIQLDESKEHID